MAIVSDSQPLIEQTAAQLAARIAAGEVSSSAVVEAYVSRIEAINPRINALVQPLFAAARQAAQQADSQERASLGPLHGVPVSIKDCFAVRGAETTLGIPGYSQGAAEEDSPLVARLRAAGAIVLGKTNVPQAMLMHECNNPLFGCTVHPADPERSPGGSTGGEAALIAAGGAPLGLASDLGGSTRQPAAACGLYGFKPTTGRLTLVGSQRALGRGMQAIAIQPGPLARSVEDIALAMSVLTSFGPDDQPLVARQVDEMSDPWKDYRSIDLSSLRIASWTDDGFFSPAVGVARAVREAAERLRSRGANVVELTPPDIRMMFRTYLGLISADGMASVRQLIRGGSVDPQLARQARLAALPRWLREGLSPLLALSGQQELSELLRWTGARSAASYWRLTADALGFRQAFWVRLAGLAGGPVDATLSPVYGLPALRHGTALHLLRAASHTFLANLLDAPAGVAPWGSVTTEDEQAELAARPGQGLLGSLSSDRYARENAQGSAGLPLAVEVMAPPRGDEVALAVMAGLC